MKRRAKGQRVLEKTNAEGPRDGTASSGIEKR